MEVRVTKRNIYGGSSDSFDVVRDGVVVASGVRHKRAFRSEWVLLTTEGRYQSKADMLTAMGA